MSSEEWSSSEEEEEGYPTLQLNEPIQSKATIEVIHIEKVRQIQSELIRELCEQFGLNDEQATFLLVRYRWDIDQVRACCIGSADLDSVLYPGSSSSLSARSAQSCPICWGPVAEVLTRLPCGHVFCTSCLSGYLKAALDNKVAVLRTQCPLAEECLLTIPRTVFEQMLSPAEFQHYLHFQAEHYVESSPFIKWCPGTDCPFAVKCTSPRIESVRCYLDHEWCFNCQEEPHLPLSCEQFQQWKRLDPDSLNEQWKLCHTKPCPKCHANIDKNEGCMHMTCRCGYEFCWLCMADWSRHGSDRRNFDCAKEMARRHSKEAQHDRATASMNWVRYNFCSEMYLEQQRSSRFAQKKRTKKIEEADQIGNVLGVPTTAFTFIEEACEGIIKARYMLKNSYALVYLLQSQAKINLCEDFQQQLSYHLDVLDKITDRDLQDLAFAKRIELVLNEVYREFRATVLDKTHALKSLLAGFQDFVEQGFPGLSGEGTATQSSVWICAVCMKQHQAIAQTCPNCGQARVS